MKERQRKRIENINKIDFKKHFIFMFCRECKCNRKHAEGVSYFDIEKPVKCDLAPNDPRQYDPFYNMHENEYGEIVPDLEVVTEKMVYVECLKCGKFEKYPINTYVNWLKMNKI